MTALALRNFSAAQGLSTPQPSPWGESQPNPAGRWAAGLTALAPCLCPVCVDCNAKLSCKCRCSRLNGSPVVQGSQQRPDHNDQQGRSLTITIYKTTSVGAPSNTSKTLSNSLLKAVWVCHRKSGPRIPATPGCWSAEPNWAPVQNATEPRNQTRRQEKQHFPLSAISPFTLALN